MKIEDMLKQQEKRGLKQNTIKAQMQSYDDYVKDDASPRPYNTPNVLDLIGGLDKSIRDTKTIPAAELIRDTEIKSSAEFIRDISEKSPRTGRPVKGKKYQYSDLSGNLKKLVDEIANRCVVIGDLTIPNINKIDFSKNTGVKIGAIKTTITRLNEKGVITYYEATKGRNSSWKFVLSSEILDEYIRIIRGK